MSSSHQGHQELSQGLHQGPHHHDTISNQHIIYNIPSIPLNHQVCGSKGLFKVFFTMQEASPFKDSTSTSIHYHKDIFKVPKASTCQPRLLQGFQDSIKPSITMQATNDHRMGHLAHLVFQRLIYHAKGIHGLLQPPEPYKRTSKGQYIFYGDARSSSGVL